MTMERALFEVIKGIAGLGVGSGSTPDPYRIYAALAKKNAATPFIVYQRIETTQWRSINGPSGISQALMQIDVYDKLPLDVKETADKLAAALDGYRNTVTIPGTSPAQQIRFAGISLQNAVDIFDQTDQPFLHRVSMDFLVTFEPLGS